MKKVLSYMFVLITMFMQLNIAFAASNLEEGVSQLANQISKSMQEKQKQKIAIIDFSDLNGNVTALGQFMAEELTTQLFIIAPGKFEVVERRQLLKLEEELVLGHVGIIEEKGIKKMGQVLGVDAIVTGSMTDLGNTVKINARLIAVESAKVFAVAATDIPKTGMVADLLRKQAEGKQVTSSDRKPSESYTTTNGGQREEVQKFIFELKECKMSGQNVDCNLLISNKDEKDRMLAIGKGNWDGSSRMFDEQGNEYTAQEGQLGNKINDESSRYVSNNLASGIPIKASITFRGVSKVASTISLLQINCIYDNDGNKVVSVQFRNIPLSR